MEGDKPLVHGRGWRDPRGFDEVTTALLMQDTLQ